MSFFMDPTLMNRVAIALLLLSGLDLLGLWLDPRLITGVNPWLKPLKFNLSIAIFLFTMAWILRYLQEPWRSGFEVGFTAFMVVEAVAIHLQAARGTTSHYNLSTPIDATIFGAMALAIMLNTALLFALWIALFLSDLPISRAYAWSIQLGLVLLLAGSAVGFAMVANRGYAVGVPDGGPGLPLLNWSTHGGDLRIAHFIGVHGIQILMCVGYVLGESERWKISQLRASACVLLIFFVMSAAIGWTYASAKKGRPLLGNGKWNGAFVGKKTALS
jgi:hypothetical protein